jgi:Na+/H+ antiporter NhaC
MSLSSQGGGDIGYIILGSIAAVLAGAVFGDHCSPISDTTVMSSMASGCDHIEHVRTQLPYALIAGGVALFAGYIPIGFGAPWWLSLLLGAGALLLIMIVAGKRSAATEEHHSKVVSPWKARV